MRSGTYVRRQSYRLRTEIPKSTQILHIGLAKVMSLKTYRETISVGDMWRWSGGAALLGALSFSTLARRLTLIPQYVDKKIPYGIELEFPVENHTT